jgi:poly-gamma-glutamate capsule biosynthesis protein CapA/YwtB (metallophosphatase superfamily)
LNLYRAAGIATTAGGQTLDQARQPLLITQHGNRITLLSCNWSGPGYALAKTDRPGAAFCDREWLRATIPQLAQNADVLIVSVQYVEMPAFQPFGQQRIDFRELAALGANVVIGTQAHTPQMFEYYPATHGEAFIHYGLGNLYFDQAGFQRQFFMDQFFVYAGRLLTVDLFTGTIEGFGHPRPMIEDERHYFLRMMFEQSGFWH